MSKSADIILHMLQATEKSQSWLAKQLGVSDQNLNYRLNKATDLYADEYEEMLDAFEKEGIIMNTDKEVSMLKDVTLEFGSLLGNGISNFSHLVKKFCDNDNKIDDDERARLVSELKSLKKEANLQFDSMIEMLEHGRVK